MNDLNMDLKQAVRDACLMIIVAGSLSACGKGSPSSQTYIDPVPPDTAQAIRQLANFGSAPLTVHFDRLTSVQLINDEVFIHCFLTCTLDGTCLPCGGRPNPRVVVTGDGWISHPLIDPQPLYVLAKGISLSLTYPTSLPNAMTCLSKVNQALIDNAEFTYGIEGKVIDDYPTPIPVFPHSGGSGSVGESFGSSGSSDAGVVVSAQTLISAATSSDSSSLAQPPLVVLPPNPGPFPSPEFGAQIEVSWLLSCDEGSKGTPPQAPDPIVIVKPSPDEPQ